MKSHRRVPDSGTILHFGDALLAGAVRTTEDLAVALHAVADDARATVWAGRRQHVNRAFITVKGVRVAFMRGHGKGFVDLLYTIAR